MAYANGDTTRTQMHDTLKLLHGTILKQIKAANRQSNIMIGLTVALLIFTVALFYAAYKTAAVDKLINTPNYSQETNTNHRITEKDVNLKPSIQVVPPVVKDGNI